jgi:hypothetical protein
MPSTSHSLREPATGFDWESVEDPVDLVREELHLTRAQAERVWHWHLQRGRADYAGEQTVAMRLLLWLGSADDERMDMRSIRRPERAESDQDLRPLERRIGLRAAVAIKQMQPYSRLSRLSLRALEKIFRVDRKEIRRLAADFRNAFTLK